jgi:predicted outer membrane repeat protein
VGGGVFAASTVDAVYSTIAENSASIGGGIYSQSTVTLNDSTVSGNTADVGGAVYGDGELVLYSSTVAFNTATTAEGSSGIFSQNGPITMFSSIVASNLTNNNTPAIDLSSAKMFLVAGSHNIVTSSTLALPGDNDPKDPKLGPLSDNGGPTRTHLPLTGSPALASGINRSDKLLVDQRQLSRGIPGNIDIGSVQESLFKSDFESDSVEGGHGGAQQVDRSVVQDFP